MVLEVHPALESAFQEADKDDDQLDEFAVRDRLARVMADLVGPTAGERKGGFAVVEALNFQHPRLYGVPIWQMHWQPLGSATDTAGRQHSSPDVTQVDDEVIQEWSNRAVSARHPLLRARYADLAWEVARFRRSELTRRADVIMARVAVDGYLDAVERSLTAEDLYAWVYIERALELAASISDAARVQRAKAVLFRFQADSEARGPYLFRRFHEIAWSQAEALALSDADRTVIVQTLERQLALRANIADPKVLDPHLARVAADCLGQWYEFSGKKAEARRAALTAGAAFEAAAAQASGLTAIAWLSEQAARYRQLGDEASVARVEQAIRDRASDAQGEMTRISVPIEVPREELDAWADKVAGETLEAGLQGFAAAGLIHRNLSERAVLDMAAQSPLSADISISITGRDGFTKATIGSVDGDLDGRTVHHAAHQLSQAAPFLNVAWKRLSDRHAVDLERLVEYLSRCPLFPPSRLSFIREGLGAWFAGDAVKAIHVLVPQIESALRDVLAALGGAVTKPDPNGGGFQMISLGEVLNHERFRAAVPEDIRFHFKVLYQDPRGLNVRNELAHGIAAFELFGLGLANIVVHSVIVIGVLRAIGQPLGREASGLGPAG